jgi:hypothetical protein
MLLFARLGPLRFNHSWRQRDRRVGHDSLDEQFREHQVGSYAYDQWQCNSCQQSGRSDRAGHDRFANTGRRKRTSLRFERFVLRIGIFSLCLQTFSDPLWAQ